MSDKASQVTGKKKSITENNLTYSLFNPYLYHEAKVNIHLYEGMLIRRQHTDQSKLRILVDLIKNNEYKDITSHLIYNSFHLSTEEEKNGIWEDILEFREISKADIEKYRENYKSTCLNELLFRSNSINDPEKKLEYLREHDYKDSFSTQIRVQTFEEAADSDEDRLMSSGVHAPLSFIDRASPINEYINGQLICYSGSPGCFTKHTKVRTDKGNLSFLDISERIKTGEKFKTWTWDFKLGKFVESNIVDSFESTKVQVYLQVYYDDIEGVQKQVSCTFDHRFLVKKESELQWIQAMDLVHGDLIKSENGFIKCLGVQETISPMSTLVLDGMGDGFEHMYDIEVDHEDHNFMLADGLVVHNSGKSLWLMHQAAIAANAGKRVLYSAFGDLKPSDFLTRIAAMVTEKPMREVYLELDDNIDQAKNFLKGNLNISCSPSQKVTAKEYVNYCLDRKDDYDVFMLDYDANLATDADSMYEAGGKLYDYLTEITALNKLVFVASQPKIHTWNQEILGLDSLNESSRKQHILDVVITISRARGANHVGIMNIAKNRRGSLDSKPVILSSCGKFVELSQEKYQQLNNNPNKLSYNELLYRNLVQTSGAVDQFMDQLNSSKIIVP